MTEWHRKAHDACSFQTFRLGALKGRQLKQATLMAGSTGHMNGWLHWALVWEAGARDSIPLHRHLLAPGSAAFCVKEQVIIK